jgi:hypothetical protein
MQVQLERRSYVMFDISSIPPGSMVSAAWLTLCRTNSSGGGTTHELRPPIAGWTEGGLTWNTQPTLSTTVLHNIPVPGSADCVTVSVKENVQSWLLGAANFGWRITDTDEPNADLIEWATSENGSASERPKLEVTYTPP